MAKKNKKQDLPLFSTEKPLENAKMPNPPNSKMNLWSSPKLQGWLIFAYAFLLYANTLSHDFCQDDAIVITENMFTTQGVSGVSGILSYDTFYGFFKEAGKASLVEGGRYRPFTIVMFAVEYQIFGKSPLAGHFFNVIWFAITGVMLYFLLLKLLEMSNYNQIGSKKINAQLIAFIAALIFVAHPIHTEAVANIKGRDEIMALLGSLTAVWFSIKAFEKGGILNSIIAFVLFFIALMSKENAVTFVVIVPMIYWFFGKTDWLTAIKNSLPFAAAAILFILLRGSIIGFKFGGTSNELMNNPYLKLVDNQYVAFSFSEKLATIIFTLGKYIQLLFVPFPLTHDYYPRHVGIMGFGDGQVLLSILVYFGLFALILRGWQKRDLVSFGIAFFLVTLSIVSNLVFAVGTNMAERFAFMPSVGFCLVVAILANYYLSENRVKMMLVPLIAVAFGSQTIYRNLAWKDNYTIFTTDIETSPNSAKLQCSVGGETIAKYLNEPNLETRKMKMEEAIGHLKRSLEIHPTFKNPYLLLGNAYFYVQNYDNSIENYKKALALDPVFRDAKTNLAVAYRDGGKYYGQQKNDIPKAIEYLAKATEINPQDAVALSFLGTAYGMSGQPKKSIEVLTQALDIRGDAQDAQNLSVSYRQIGDKAKAEEWLEKAKTMQK